MLDAHPNGIMFCREANLVAYGRKNSFFLTTNLWAAHPIFRLLTQK